ncbi:MAG TPA: anthranilate phosphoribosyltransferase [Firmicutes bacterium]|nr:anthranilate phosphoribosyltransferase [Bacillota bacterium]
MKELISKLVTGESLNTEEMAGAMRLVMEGAATPAQIGGFLTALRAKGETVEEIYGAALVMREKAVRICAGKKGLLDTCGTGGDGKNTFNISTAVAFVVAAAGVPVAKHGNRAVSSACGSADVLEELGVEVNLHPEQVEYCIEKTGIGFMFAPHFHQAMKYAVGPRKELGFRTVFNILGPLTNPAGAELQLLGVYDEKLLPVLAQVLALLGVKNALVVHGAGGVDELSLAGENQLCRVRQGKVESSFRLTPEEVGLARAPLEEIRGGDAKENARILQEVFQGATGPRRDVVLLNGAATLLAAEKVETMLDGVKLAAEVIDSGAALRKLEELIEVSRRCARQEKTRCS